MLQKKEKNQLATKNDEVDELISLKEEISELKGKINYLFSMFIILFMIVPNPFLNTDGNKNYSIATYAVKNVADSSFHIRKVIVYLKDSNSKFFNDTGKILEITTLPIILSSDLIDVIYNN